MKRLTAIIAAILLLIMPAAALAQEGETTPVQTTFEIDSTHLFEGMDRTYSQGYAPVIKDGKLTVILPIKAKEGESSITVTPELGDPTSAPFSFKSYQKNVRPSLKKIEGTDKSAWIYYIRFDFSLKKDRINGTYPIALNISGKDAAQSFTVYAVITDGKSPEPQESEPAKPTSKPVVIVETSEITPNMPKAGEKFKLKAVLKNTSERKSVSNMTVTVSADAGISLDENSATIYIDKIATGKTHELELEFSADAAAAPANYAITLAMSYDSAEASGVETLSSAGSIGVQITQPIRLEMTLPTIPETVNAGDTIPMSFQAMNLGRGKVYNVRCELDVPGLLPTGSAFFGNMEAGTAMNADLNVFIGTMDMSENYTGTEKYGYTHGTATLIYEDENGEEYTREYEITTTINQPPAQEVSADTQPEQMGQWWITVAIIAGALAAAGVVTLIIKRRKKHESS